ncbi:hypothetical protein [Streptomyces sp. NPDC056707]|uniref:hypothetical protein n=1 Tax=Streptomyces sp. NPDC056707 TaxID=3345919 RepID=UPI0036B9B02E
METFAESFRICPSEPGCQQFVDGRVRDAGAISEAVPPQPLRAGGIFFWLGAGWALLFWRWQRIYGLIIVAGLDKGHRDESVCIG